MAKRKNEDVNHKALISKRLKKYHSSEEIVNVARRLFQKFPPIIEALEHKLDMTLTKDKVEIAITDILRLIELALQKKIRDEKGEIVQFPTNPENYLSFCDLQEVVSHPASKLWHTFVLQDQMDVLERLHGPNGLPLLKIRKSLKKKLENEKQLASVQMEIRMSQTGMRIVFLRIATANKPKKISKENAEKKLLSAKATYLVYFPGEHYFYADSSVPNEIHCQALIDVLKCSAYEEIPLNGRDIESLRQLRFNRDQPENIDPELWMDTEKTLPTLNLFTVSAVNDMRNNENLLVEQDVKSSIEVKGSDVLNALRQISLESKDIISQNPPAWMKKAVFRGRNQVCIRPRKTVPTSTPRSAKIQKNKQKSRIIIEDGDEELDDEMSMASDKTVFNH